MNIANPKLLAVLAATLILLFGGNPAPAEGDDRDRLTDEIVAGVLDGCLSTAEARDRYTDSERQELRLVAQGEKELSAEWSERLFKQLESESESACTQALVFLLVQSGRIATLDDVPGNLKGRAWGALLMTGKAPAFGADVDALLEEYIDSTDGPGYKYWVLTDPLTTNYTYPDLERHLGTMLDRCWKWGANYPELASVADSPPWPSQVILDAIEARYPDQLVPFLSSRLTGLERLFLKNQPAMSRYKPGWSIAAGLRPAIEMLVEESGNSAEVQELLRAEAARLEQLADELESDIGSLAEEVAISNAKGEYVSDVDRNKVTVAEWKIEEFREIARTMREVTVVPELTPSAGEE